MAESGRAFNQAPVSLFCAGRRRAYDFTSGDNLISFMKVAFILGVYQLFRHMEAVAGGGDSSRPSFQTSTPRCVEGRRHPLGRGEELANEDGGTHSWSQKGKRSKLSYHLNLQPTWPNSKVCLDPCCVVVQNVYTVFAMDPSNDLCNRSKSWRLVERKHWDVFREKSVLGRGSAWWRRQKASWACNCSSVWSACIITCRASLLALMVLSSLSVLTMGESKSVASLRSATWRRGATEA